jgi:hypothetical protein
MQISSELSDSIARSVNLLLQHKYDLTNYTDTGEVDEYNQPILEADDPIEDQDCLFIWDDVTATTERGTTIEQVPLLYAKNTDTIRVGSLVTNVRDTKGIVLLRTARVTLVDPVANLGSSIVRECKLEGVTF